MLYLIDIPNPLIFLVIAAVATAMLPDVFMIVTNCNIMTMRPAVSAIKLPRQRAPKGIISIFKAGKSEIGFIRKSGAAQ